MASYCRLLRLSLALAMLTCLSLESNRAYASEISAPLTGAFSSVGELTGVGYYGQTFVSPGGTAQELTVYVGPTTDGGGVKFRVLLTDVGFDGGFHLTTVLFESDTLLKRLTFPLVPEPFTVDLGGIPLEVNKTYAFVLDFCSEFDGIWESTSVGTGPFPDGIGFRRSPNPTPPVPCLRENLFFPGWITAFTPELAFNLQIADELSVAIDIKPSGFPNSINPFAHGVIPVAILGSDTFDITEIDVTTLAFGPDSASTAHNLADSLTYTDHMQDVNLDGYVDLVCHFRMGETGISYGDETAALTGQTISSQAFDGFDSIRTVGFNFRRGRGQHRSRNPEEPE